MRVLRSIICWVGLSAATALYCQAKGWCGIEPLRSTRADVERVLSLQGEQCRCCQDTGLEFVYAQYSKGRCEGNPAGWDVPADTVLKIHLRPKSELLFSSLGLDRSRYAVSADDAFFTYYASRGEGVRYSISNDRVESISYMPTTADRDLRCPGFPEEDGSLTVYRAFDEYSNLTFRDERARLDNFAIMLQEVPEWRGYIVVYAGRRARPNEAKVRGERNRRYVIERRGVEPERVVTIDGGHREIYTVELHVIHKDYHPPAPRATVSAKEVQIIRGSGRKRGARGH